MNPIKKYSCASRSEHGVAWWSCTEDRRSDGTVDCEGAARGVDDVEDMDEDREGVGLVDGMVMDGVAVLIVVVVWMLKGIVRLRRIYLIE